MCRVKNIVLHIVIGVVCINSFSLQQLYKIPMLVVHYQEHHALDASVGFIDFLGMHYWGTDLNDDDDDRDNELPFKKFEHDAISQPLDFPVSVALTLHTPPNYNTVFSRYQAPHFENAPMGSLFKPPRVA